MVAPVTQLPRPRRSLAAIAVGRLLPWTPGTRTGISSEGGPAPHTAHPHPHPDPAPVPPHSYPPPHVQAAAKPAPQEAPGMTELVEHGQLFIGGELTDPLGSDVIEVISPHTEQVIGRVPHACRADVDRAVAAARRAFD